MDLFLIILSGVCLISLAIYWIRLWREARDRKRAKALHRVADEKAAVRGLAHQRAPGASDDSQLSPEEAKAMEAMGWGTDDSRWEPGTTAVDALIKERDKLLAQVQVLTAENTALRDPITHALAMSFPWYCMDANGEEKMFVGRPLRIDDIWYLPGALLPWHRLGKTMVWADWRYSLLHYNKETRSWVEPA